MSLLLKPSSTRVNSCFCRFESLTRPSAEGVFEVVTFFPSEFFSNEIKNFVGCLTLESPL